MDHRELLKNFYLFTDATVNDLRALEAIGEPRVCIAGDLVYSEGEIAVAAKGSMLMTLDANVITAGAYFYSRAPSAATGAFTQLAAITSAGSIIMTGPVGQKSTGTTWANPSDRRIKDEITDYATGLDIVTQLQPRTFVYNGKGGSTAGMVGYGFIADEVAAVMPEMVGTTRAKLNSEDEELTDIQTVDQSNLILALVNAVKELAARVEELEVLEA